MTFLGCWDGKLPARVACLAGAVLAGGCSYSGGEALYMMGLVPKPTVKAAFTLTEGPVAILVDDPQELLHWPEVEPMLAERLADELHTHKAAPSLIPQSRIMQLRRTDPEFDQRGCREIGRKVGAHQVLWLQVQSFRATENATEAMAAAQMSVAVKVINALEETDRTKVRLWPDRPDGESVEVQLSASEVMKAEDRQGICRELTAKLAERVAMNFYDHKQKDFDAD